MHVHLFFAPAYLYYWHGLSSALCAPGRRFHLLGVCDQDMAEDLAEDREPPWYNVPYLLLGMLPKFNHVASSSVREYRDSHVEVAVPVSRADCGQQLGRRPTEKPGCRHCKLHGGLPSLGRWPKPAAPVRAPGPVQLVNKVADVKVGCRSVCVCVCVHAGGCAYCSKEHIGCCLRTSVCVHTTCTHIVHSPPPMNLVQCLHHKCQKLCVKMFAPTFAHMA